MERAKNQNKLSQEPDSQRHSVSVAEWHEVFVHASTGYLVSQTVGYFQHHFWSQGNK